MSRRAGRALLCGLLCLLVGLALPVGAPRAAGDAEDVEIALSLATLLRSARAVISANQDLINNPEIGDKGLTSAVVLEKAIEKYQAKTGSDPRTLDPETRKGRLLSAQVEAIVEVMDENQTTINKQGQGFKGFVPAVFGRLINERFRVKMGDQAEVKVTAPATLVRNRKALPDPWETEVIETKLMLPDWPKDETFTAETENRGRAAFRVMIPEYYSQGCLKCHGAPKGEIDLTGYPKEGGSLGDLGGVISITLYR